MRFSEHRRAALGIELVSETAFVSQKPPSAMEAKTLIQRKETLRWQARSSLKGMTPKLVRFAFMSALLIAFFRLGLGHLPHWLCSSSDELCVAMDQQLFNEIWFWAQWLMYGALGLMTLSLMVAILRQQSTYIRLTNQRLQAQHGLFKRKIDDIELHAIRDTSMEQGLIDRLLGIGQVTVVSADPTNPVLVLEDMPEPMRLREEIRAAALGIDPP